MLIRQDMPLQAEIDSLGPEKKRGSAAGGALSAGMFSGSDADRFWAKVAKAGPDDCWPWLATAYAPIGATRRACYGMFSAGGKMLKAHRVALVLSGRPLSFGQVAMHACDNPRCCNPAHLRAGTPSENMADMSAKARHPKPQGSAHHNAKMTEEGAAQLRAAYQQGETGAALAKRFGISKSQAFNIIHGRQWRHV
jgi:hypothetical protein